MVHPVLRVHVAGPVPQLTTAEHVTQTGGAGAGQTRGWWQPRRCSFDEVDASAEVTQWGRFTPAAATSHLYAEQCASHRHSPSHQD